MKEKSTGITITRKLNKLTYLSLYKNSTGIPCYLCKLSDSQGTYFCHISSDLTFEMVSTRPGGNPGFPFNTTLTSSCKGFRIRIYSNWFKLERIEEWN